jgi:hypothetical protein
LKLIHKISKISTRAIFSKCIESGDMEEQFWKSVSVIVESSWGISLLALKIAR